MINNLLDRKGVLCVNCGKLLNMKTLICDACGTDYNEKPQCDHVYDQWEIASSPMEFHCDLYLKCSKCGEFVKLKCDPYMLRDIASKPYYFIR